MVGEKGGGNGGWIVVRYTKGGRIRAAFNLAKLRSNAPIGGGHERGEAAGRRDVAQFFDVLRSARHATPRTRAHATTSRGRGINENLRDAKRARKSRKSRCFFFSRENRNSARWIVPLVRRYYSRLAKFNSPNANERGRHARHARHALEAYGSRATEAKRDDDDELRRTTVYADGCSNSAFVLSARFQVFRRSFLISR